MKISTETRDYPIHREVARKISERVEKEGYGFLIPHAELHEMLEIKKPQTVEEAMSHGIEVVCRVDALRNELLYVYQICLDNEFSTGYRVLTPDDQVKRAFNKFFRRAVRNISKAIAVVTHVDVDRLSDAGVVQRDRSLRKALFVMSSFAGRRRQIAGGNGKKMIG